VQVSTDRTVLCKLKFRLCRCPPLSFFLGNFEIITVILELQVINYSLIDLLRAETAELKVHFARSSCQLREDVIRRDSRSLDWVVLTAEPLKYSQIL
jgi:hypothetical protein